MSAIINFSLDVKSLPKEKFQQHSNGKVYINLTMSVNDETRYGNNTGIYVSQTKEEREAKKKKTYLGNGKVAWISDNGIVLAERDQQEVPHQSKEVADLPF